MIGVVVDRFGQSRTDMVHGANIHLTASFASHIDYHLKRSLTIFSQHVHVLLMFSLLVVLTQSHYKFVARFIHMYIEANFFIQFLYFLQSTSVTSAAYKHFWGPGPELFLMRHKNMSK